MTDQLRRNANLVEMLGGALRDGGHALGSAPALLKQILQEQSWREFVTQRGEHVEHERFANFVVTPPLAGLGATVKLIQKVVDAIEDAAERAKVQNLLDTALQNPVGINQHVSNIHSLPDRPAGTTKDRALRKLRKDAPELHAEVLAGRLSAHAAMVQAGYWPPTFTVRADNADATARALRRHMKPDQLAELARLLTEG